MHNIKNIFFEALKKNGIFFKKYFHKRKKTLHLQSRTIRVWYGTIAQSVEQRTENPCVAGSIPAGTTLRGSLIGAFVV
jgi:hypothetical protein